MNDDKLERDIRWALRFDLGWFPDDARLHAEELAPLVAHRLLTFDDE